MPRSQNLCLLAKIASGCVAWLLLTSATVAQFPPPLPGPDPDPPPIPGSGDGNGFPDIVIPPGAVVTIMPGGVQITVRSNPNGPELAETAALDLAPQVFLVNTPIGEIPITVRPAGPNVTAAPAPIPQPPSFRPPPIFSAPLPAGSGARALGFAGAFVAIADDATAASWNPAGLVQLERPEISAVFRYSYTKNDHTSSDPDFIVDENDYNSEGVNYMSAAIPYFFESADRKAVFSLNYQEAYDFTHSFRSRIKDGSSRRATSSNSRTFTESQTDTLFFETGSIEMKISSEFTTRSSSTLNQIIETALTSDLQFEQEGVIEAASPAFALEISPTLSFGAALNYYQDSPFSSRKIRSRTFASYVATSESTAHVIDRRSTTGSFTSHGVVGIPDAGVTPGFEFDLGESSGTYPEFGDSSSSTERDSSMVRGTYEEINEFDDLHGYNANFGLLWTASKYLDFGFSMDLPWTADAEQKKTVRTTADTFDGSGSRLINSDESVLTEMKNVEFDFPLFWTVGASARIPGKWWPRLRTSVDVGQTLWSNFAFTVEGEGKLNPLDGTPYGENKIDDTWFARGGVEYIWLLKKTEIPFRIGLIWEQRPAIGNPDEYRGFTLGSGISLGKDPGKLIIDFAYSYLAADGVQTVVPEQAGLTTDTKQQQFFISAIYHF